jgi:hypothetical protein
MFRLIRSLTLKQGLTEQLPALVGALFLAEAFYKFHSFLLECGAFLATWFVLDALFQGAGRLLARRAPARLPALDHGGGASPPGVADVPPGRAGVG